MIKKIILTLILILSLCSFVTAIESTDTQLILLQNMYETSGDLKDDKLNTNTPLFGFSPTGTPAYSQAAISPYGTSSIRFSGDDYFVNSTLKSYAPYGNFAFGMWIRNYDTAMAANHHYFSNRDTDGSIQGYGLDSRDGGRPFGCFYWNSGAEVYADDTIIHNTAFYVCNQNSTHWSIWVNGTQIEAQANTPSATVIGTGDFYIGAGDGGSGLKANADIENVFFINRSLTAAEINSIYTTGILAPATPTTSPPAFVSPTPNASQHINYLPLINCSHNSTDINFYLYEDNVLIYNNITSNYTTGITYQPGTLTEAAHTYSCGVQNITSGLFSINVTRTFTYDVTSPEINLFLSNNWKTDNQTIISSYFYPLIINVSFADDNLDQALINVSNSAGVTVLSYLNTSITGTTLNVSKVYNISSLPLGRYKISFEASDSHTITAIPDYKIKTGLFNDYLEFNTEYENTIRIKAKDEMFNINEFNAIKDIDRYSFNVNFKDFKQQRTFILTSDHPIRYLPGSKYTAHFITNGNWIDFEEAEIKKEDVSVNIIDAYTAEITIKNLKKQQFLFKSIGGLNFNQLEYEFTIGGVLNITAFDPILNKFVNFTSSVNGILKNSSVTSNSTQYENLTVGTIDLIVSSPGYDAMNESLFFNTSYLSKNVLMYLSNVVDDCTIYNQTILTVAGKDEENNQDVNMSLDITFTHYATRNSTNIKNTSLILRNKYNYSLCTNINQTFIVDALMQYGDDAIYTKRLYYLVDYVANSSQPNIIYLYHLNTSLRTEVIFSVYNILTGASVPNAYIKTQRYYPGENVYRTVEITKTDDDGQTIGKMRLADIFYKFIIEEPAGSVRLNTEVLRLLTTTRAFGINYETAYLDTFNKINDVSISTTCTHDTQTCRVVWSDASNIVQDVTLEVYRKTGLRTDLIYTQTVASTSGTIAYTVVEDTAGNTYEARSYIESNTGTSTYFGGLAEMIFSDNPFFDNNSQRLASLFPLFLLSVVVVFAFIDFGAIGVSIGALLGLIIGAITKILPISPFYFMAFIVMGLILIYKLNK